MKKITMLLAAIGLAASTTVFAQDLVKVSTPYAFLKDGTRVTGTLDELCNQLAINNSPATTEKAYFKGFKTESNGHPERKLACWVKKTYNAEYIPVSSYGPAICHEGGLYSNHPDYCYSPLE